MARRIDASDSVLVKGYAEKAKDNVMGRGAWCFPNAPREGTRFSTQHEREARAQFSGAVEEDGFTTGTSGTWFQEARGNFSAKLEKTRGG